MKKKHDSYWLSGMPQAAGCAFRLLHLGRLATEGGRIYTFGGYHCWHIVCRGRGFVKCGGKKFLLERGDMFSVMAENEIEYGPHPGTDWEFCYLRIDGKEAAALTARIGLTPQLPVIRFPWKEEVISMFLLLLDAAKRNENGPEFFAARILQLVDRLTSGPRTNRISDSALVKEAQRIMRDPMCRPVNVNELADMLRISRIKLFNAFKSVTGGSPLHELQKIRIETCRRLLLETPELPLSRLAAQTAFPNEKYFIRVFRQHTGMTPGEYRKGNNRTIEQ